MSWNLVGFMANSNNIVHKMAVRRQAALLPRFESEQLLSHTQRPQLTGLCVSCKLFELCGFPVHGSFWSAPTSRAIHSVSLRALIASPDGMSPLSQGEGHGFRHKRHSRRARA